MSDPKANEFPDLPDLPDLEEVPELPDLPEDPPATAEVAPAGEVTPTPAPTPATPAPVAAPLEDLGSTPIPAPAAPGTNEMGAGDKPPLRVLDKAPFHLRRAALIVTIGSLLPWMPWLAQLRRDSIEAGEPGAVGGWFTAIVAKVLVLAGLWIWYSQVQHNWGPKLTGFLGKLGELHLKPKPKPKKEDERTKARRAKAAQPQQLAALEHPFPTGLHALSLLVIILGAVAVPQLDRLSGKAMGIAVAELGMLAWAAGTYVHIHAYERWGRFSPIFPLMFLAMVFAGLLSVVAGFGEFGDSALIGLAMVVGGGTVAFGGGLAGYTIVEALRAAKKEGDEKKKTAADARKAQREARKTEPTSAPREGS